MKLFNRLQLFLVSLFFLGAAACQSASAPVTAPTSPATVAVQGPTDVTAQYALGSGDKVRITVFGEPELSGEFVVDGGGAISMPLIGEVNAAGLDIRQLQRRIETLFRNDYLKEPRVSAEILNYRPFYIMGEVNRPGEYPYTAGLTVLNAVATAQGFTYRANKKAVFVRGANAANENETPLTSSTMVQPGDTIRIGERLF